jgi:putative lipase involved disintegration of autophagic bodies
MTTKYHIRTLLCLVVKYSIITDFMFVGKRMWNYNQEEMTKQAVASSFGNHRTWNGQEAD